MKALFFHSILALESCNLYFTLLFRFISLPREVLALEHLKQSSGLHTVSTTCVTASWNCDISPKTVATGTRFTCWRFRFFNVLHEKHSPYRHGWHRGSFPSSQSYLKFSNLLYIFTGTYQTDNGCVGSGSGVAVRLNFHCKCSLGIVKPIVRFKRTPLVRFCFSLYK